MGSEIMRDWWWARTRLSSHWGLGVSPSDLKERELLGARCWGRTGTFMNVEFSKEDGFNHISGGSQYRWTASSLHVVKLQTTKLKCVWEWVKKDGLCEPLTLSKSPTLH